jgi:choline dehydrogenase
VLTGAQAVKLNFSGTRCTGVDYLIAGKLHSAHASSETILAAGAFDTPRLLLLSGIGPQDDLKQLGIPTRLELPGVGQNLQDHILLTGIYFEAKQAIGTQTRGSSASFWKSRSDLDTPDLMFITTQAPPVTSTGHKVAVSESTFSIRPALMRVASRGKLRLLAAAHDGAMDIQPNFLAEKADIDALVSSIEISLEVASQPAFRDLINTRIDPVTRPNRAEAEAFLRQTCISYMHPVGTCAMGSGRNAVVDARLRVHGIEGLRIADASVMPKIPSANIHAATIMVGEFAARAIAAVR